MNQLDKEDGVLGFNAQGGDPELEPESKRIKLDYDVEDPIIQHVKENQVDDGFREPTKEAMSDTSTHVQRSKTKYEDPYSLCFDTDTDDDSKDNEDKMSAHEASRLDTLQEWDRELAEKGIDVEKLKKKWVNWKGKCRWCLHVDMHPSDECPYCEFLYY